MSNNNSESPAKAAASNTGQQAPTVKTNANKTFIPAWMKKWEGKGSDKDE